MPTLGTIKLINRDNLQIDNDSINARGRQTLACLLKNQVSEYVDNSFG